MQTEKFSVCIFYQFHIPRGDILHLEAPATARFYKFRRIPPPKLLYRPVLFKFGTGFKILDAQPYEAVEAIINNYRDGACICILTRNAYAHIERADMMSVGVTAPVFAYLPVTPTLIISARSMCDIHFINEGSPNGIT